MSIKNLQARHVVIDGVATVVEISPCSWMYPNYGLQLKVNGDSDAGRFNNFYLHIDAAFKSCTEDDMQRLIKSIHLIPCRNEGCKSKMYMSEYMANNSLFDTVNNIVRTCDSCNAAGLKAMTESFEAEQKADDIAQLKREKKKGFTHVLDFFIHHKTGSDKQYRAFLKGAPSQEEIKAYLRKKGSVVDTDFKVSTIEEIETELRSN